MPIHAPSVHSHGRRRPTRFAACAGVAVAAVLGAAAPATAGTGYVGWGGENVSASGGPGFNYWGQGVFSFKTGSSSELIKSFGLLISTSSTTSASLSLYAVADSYDVASYFSPADSSNNAAIADGTGGTYARAHIWNVTGPQGSGSMAWNSFDLSGDNVTLNANTRYLIHLKNTGSNSFVGQSGGVSELGADGWSNVGGQALAGGSTGAWWGGPTATLAASSVIWQVGFNSSASTPAVPGPGVAMAAVLGLAGARRRRR